MVVTLRDMVDYLNDHVPEQEGPVVREHVLAPLKTTLKDFGRLEEMIEECIDMKKARQNEYLINPSFSPALRELNQEITDVKGKMEALKKQVSKDLGTSKNINLVESQNYGFIFEGDKKECDAGIRKS